MEIITTFLVKYAVESAASSIGVIVLGWILAKIPTGKWSKNMGLAGQKHGVAFNDFCKKKLGKFWNKAIEPVFIDTISVLLSYVSGFIIGLKEDNEPSK